MKPFVFGLCNAISFSVFDKKYILDAQFLDFEILYLRCYVVMFQENGTHVPFFSRHSSCSDTSFITSPSPLSRQVCR